MGVHPSHVTRSSDATTYDEICVNCGAIDGLGTWGKLTDPCPSTAEKKSEAPPRRKLPTRRAASTIWVEHITANSTHRIAVTYGYAETEHPPRIREVFCADFKAGSDQHAFVQDACVLLSVLLQTGHDVSWLLAKMGGQRSLIGALLAAMRDEEENLLEERLERPT
jgi:hypothetical protein